MISIEKRRQIHSLLQKGLPQREIARQVGVSNGTVSNAAKLLKKRQELPIVSPCLTCHESEIPELLRIVNDLQELHKLAIISHPLLSELARRARNSLKRISIESMQCCEKRQLN